MSPPYYEHYLWFCRHFFDNATYIPSALIIYDFLKKILKITNSDYMENAM
jgi:hypothetical protein